MHPVMTASFPPVSLLRSAITALAVGLLVALASAPGNAGTLAAAKPQVAGGEAANTSVADVWQMDGRRVVWQSRGGFRFDLAFDQPNGLTTNAAVQPNVFLRGLAIDRRIVGEVIEWTTGCAVPTTVPVRGWVNAERTRVVLTGERPVVEDCEVVGVEPFGLDATFVLTRSPSEGK